MSIALGRINPARVPGAWQLSRDLIPVAPRLLRGDIPHKSIDLSLYRNMRYRNQVRGTCVGQSGAAMAETTVRTPSPLTESSRPNEPIDFSPLWVYEVARAYSRAQGINLGGDGAIVTHALLAVKASGFVRWDAWPGTPENERAYRDGRVPQSAKDAPKIKAVGDVRILESWAQILEYLAGGYSVWIGIPWPEGATRTDAQGRFRLTGRSVGGHAVELMGYDQDADIAVIGNSWQDAGWGGWQGRANVGACSLSGLAKFLGDRSLSNGQSEACVVSEVEGDWAPRVRSWAEIL